jgi:hypothetical protein
MPELPPRPAFDPDAVRTEDESRSSQYEPEIHLAGALMSAPAVRSYSVQQSKVNLATPSTLVVAAHQFLYGPAAPHRLASATGMPALGDPAGAGRDAKIEREAQVAIEVVDVPTGANAVLALVGDYKGFVTKDERFTYGNPNAALVVRVPASAFDAFLVALARVGEIKSRRILATDATTEHKDIEILVANLEAAQSRYREILQRATDPGQILAIERELERVRTDLERIKGRLDYLRDRVAYATIAVGIARAASVEPEAPGAGYQPMMATGIRVLSLVDVREGGTLGYGGAGLTLRFPRSTGDSGRGFALDVDVMRACCGSAPARSDWAYDVLTGLDLFSESLGGGTRRWFNPFLGVRMGVAQTQDRVDFAAAGVVGVDVFKTHALVVGAQLRLIALVGNPDGPHGGVQPQLGVDLGF